MLIPTKRFGPIEVQMELFPNKFESQEEFSKAYDIALKNFQLDQELWAEFYRISRIVIGV